MKKDRLLWKFELSNFIYVKDKLLFLEIYPMIYTFTERINFLQLEPGPRQWALGS